MIIVDGDNPLILGIPPMYVPAAIPAGSEQDTVWLLAPAYNTTFRTVRTIGTSPSATTAFGRPLPTAVVGGGPGATVQHPAQRTAADGGSSPGARMHSPGRSQTVRPGAGPGPSALGGREPGAKGVPTTGEAGILTRPAGRTSKIRPGG